MSKQHDSMIRQHPQGVLLQVTDQGDKDFISFTSENTNRPFHWLVGNSCIHKLLTCLHKVLRIVKYYFHFSNIDFIMLYEQAQLTPNKEAFKALIK